jgi:hypothetical protein
MNKKILYWTIIDVWLFSLNIKTQNHFFCSVLLTSDVWRKAKRSLEKKSRGKLHVR